MPSDESWHVYPADVPLDKRAPCGVAGCEQPSVAVLVKTWIPIGTSFGPHLLPDTTTRPYCAEHATALGWDGADHPLPPEHLNRFQQWVVRLLEHGDERTSS